MVDDADNLSKEVANVPQQDNDQRYQQLSGLQNYSSSCSSLTSGIGQSDHSISNDRVASASNIGQYSDSSDVDRPVAKTSELKNIDEQLRLDIKKFVDSIFTDSQSISLEKKAHFGQLVRSREARLLFAIFVDEYRVNSKRVNELTFYSLAQYFSIVLLECLLAEDFRPAKIIMNMMFTYYYEQNCDQTLPGNEPTMNEEGDTFPLSNVNRTYLYILLKDQEIFKSIRFWTSAFYESVIIERNNHPVFADRQQGKLSTEKRLEESDCSKNITFGLLSSFIYNMSLLDLSHEFCQEFLNKHSTIAGLSEEHLGMLKSNLKAMFADKSKSRYPISPTSAGEKLSTFLHKLSSKLNQSSSQAQQGR